MKPVTRGCTRIVFLFRKTVVKIPNFTYSWCHFLKGFIANMHESQTYRYNSGKCDTGMSDLLCPVVWAAWGGWILVMRRAKVLTIDEYKIANTVAHEICFPGDDKAANYGWYEGRIVKIDYGQ